MNPIKVFALKRKSAERDLAEEMFEQLQDAGWEPPAEGRRLRDALDHIRRTCHHSRTQTRRLRWISRRADLALRGEPFTFDATTEPVKAPSVPALENQLRYTQRLLAEAEAERDRLAARLEAFEADRPVVEARGA